MKKYAFLVFATALLVSCFHRGPKLHTIDLGICRLQAPLSWEKIETGAGDGNAGALSDGRDTLRYELSVYADNIPGKEYFDQLYLNDTVNGVNACLIIPAKEGEGYISVYLPAVSGKMNFSMQGCNIRHTQPVLDIFRSIVFPQSDTIYNHAITMNSFSDIVPAHGTELYREKCARCHALKKDFEGPALYPIMQERNDSWLYRFLAQRDDIPEDSLFIQDESTLKCPYFGNFTEADAAAVAMYIRNVGKCPE